MRNDWDHIITTAESEVGKLRDYWPLTLRQVYYRLVATEIIPNSIISYKQLSDRMSKARKAGRIPWDAIEDRSRVYRNLHGFVDKSMFVERSLSEFLTGYRRDLMQDQPLYLEIWTEKDALSTPFYRVGSDYSVSVGVVRGQVSTSFLKEYANRAEYFMLECRSPMILYFGDLDPSGVNIPKSAERTLKDDLNIPVEIRRVMLQPSDVTRYSLPHNPEALKWTDNNAKAYVSEFGEVAVELDAVSPGELELRLREEIESVIDLSIYREQLATQERETAELTRIRERITPLIMRELE